jgi:hypothetical protein
MHHAHEDAAGECVLKSVAPVSNVTLNALVGGLGVMPPLQGSSVLVVAAEPVPAVDAAPVFRPAKPESPPPRP